MNNIATMEKLVHEMKDMKRELDTLRSFAIHIAGRDTEGEYRPEFVREILYARSEKTFYTFDGKDSFLAKLNAHKTR